MADKQNCGGCGKICDKAFANVNGTHFHPECFKCKSCSKDLGGQPYVPKDGNFYCDTCYFDNFAPRCGHCEKPIKDAHVNAMGKAWHEDHFVCSECCGPFPGDEFKTLNDRPYCVPCHTKLTTVNCGKCGKDIDDKEMFEALDKKFHRSCFTCEHDGHLINEGDEFNNYKGKIYCQFHLGALLDLNCSVCQKIIPGQYISVLDKKMHPECWKCVDCACVLSAGNARADGGAFKCNDCVVKSGGVVIGGSQGVGGSAEDVTRAMGNLGLAPGSKESAAAAAAPIVPGVYACFPYSVLKSKGRTEGVDPACKELYLSDEEFMSVFNMDKAAFAKMPAWRRKQKKQQAKLF